MEYNSTNSYFTNSYHYRLRFQSIVLSILILLISFSLNARTLTGDFQSSNSPAFIENKGQLIDNEGNLLENVQFTVSLQGKTVYFSEDGFSYVLTKFAEDPNREEGLPSGLDLFTADFSLLGKTEQESSSSQKSISYRVDVQFKGRNPDSKTEGLNKQPTYFNYYYPHYPDGITDVASFGEIIYRDIYPHTDLVFYFSEDEAGNNAFLKYDFIVHPGGDPQKIKMQYTGAKNLSVDDQGRLLAETPFGTIVENAPVTFQPSGEKSNYNRLNKSSSEKITSRFEVDENGTVFFELDEYNPTKKLIIDPLIRVWSTFFGGSSSDRAEDIDVNGSLLYICGRTHSINFPVTPGVFDTTLNNHSDGFVSRFDTTGALIWSTFYGGSGSEHFNGISIFNEDSGIVVTGFTSSTDFPVSAGAFQTVKNGISFNDDDAVIVRLNQNGQRVWASYIGGSVKEHGLSTATDEHGNSYMTGYTESNNFPVSLGAFQSTNPGGSNSAFLSKFDASGNMIFSTYFGGDSNDVSFDISISASGLVFCTGRTLSHNFPMPGSSSPDSAFQNTLTGTTDAFIISFNNNGNYNWSTYFGGNIGDVAYSITFDKQDNFYVVGQTHSSDFPVSQNAFQANKKGNADGFIIKFNSNKQFEWGTYIGGNTSATSSLHGVATDDSGQVFVTGWANMLDFYNTVPAFHTPNLYFSAPIIIEFSPNGHYIWGSFYGGTTSIFDRSNSIAAQGAGDIYIAGRASSSDFPVTPGAYQTTQNGHIDAFIVRFTPCEFPATLVIDSATSGFCPGDSIMLQADSGYYNYLWRNVDTSFADTGNYRIPVFEDGYYYVTVRDSFGCEGYDSVYVAFHDKPEAELFPKVDTICRGDNLMIKATSNDSNLAFSWQPIASLNNEFGDSVLASPTFFTEYILTATDTLTGCTALDTSSVFVTPFDTTPPDPPEINHVSYNPDNHISVSFKPNSDSSVNHYELYRAENNGSFNKMKTQFTLDTASSLIFDTVPDPFYSTYCYFLIATDSCQTKYSAPADTHCVINLQPVDDICTKEMPAIEWSSYVGKSMNNYELLCGTSLENLTPIASLNPTENTYTDSSADLNLLYYYRLRAISGNDTVYSNTTEENFYSYCTPNIQYVTKTITDEVNGSVEIKWSSQINKFYLQHQKLYYRGPGDPNFSLLADSIPLTDSNFTHNSINTKTGEHYYFMVNIDKWESSSDSSKIHKTIDLNFDIGQLTHILYWTPYVGFEVDKYLLQQFNGTQYVTVDSVSGTDTSAIRIPQPCNHEITYRIKATGGNGLYSHSDTVTNQALDTIPPDAPVIDQLTFDANNHISLDYTGGDSLDTYGFSVRRLTPFQMEIAFDPFLTASASFSITDSSFISGMQQCYMVTSLDSCLNATPSDTFCAINLTGTPGNLLNELQWTTFNGYEIEHYILQKKNNGIWQNIDSFSNTKQFIDEPLPCNLPQTYRIAAYESSGSSGNNGNRATYSNTLTLTPFDTIPPPAPFMQSASVTSDTSVELNWFPGKESDAKFFQIWRGIDGDNFNIIDTVVYDTFYTDHNTQAQTNSYQYRVTAVDSCSSQNQSVASEVHSTMLLQGSTGACNMEIELDWTAYQGYPKSVSEYRIYRAEDGGTYQHIETLQGDQVRHTDLSVNEESNYCYRIEASSDSTNASAYSNEVCLSPWVYPEPDTAEIIRTTVQKTHDQTGSVLLEWERANPSDTFAEGYFIYHGTFSQAGPFTHLATIEDIDQLEFTHHGIDTRNTSNYYKVMIYNLCVEEGPYRKSHRPINLQLNKRNLEARLYWLPYLGFPIEQYELRRSENGGAFKTHAVISPNDTTYTDRAIRCGQHYSWQIHGHNYSYNLTTTSDSVWDTAFDTLPPGRASVHYASVSQTGTTNGAIEMNFTGPQDANRSGYDLYRSVNGAPFMLADEIPQSDATQFTDENINTAMHSHAYYIITHDSCGNYSLPSDTHRVILLNAINAGNYNQLSWTPYNGWDNLTYIVERKNSAENWHQLDTLPQHTTQHQDYDIECNSQQYRILAVKVTGNDTLISYSNVVEVKPDEQSLPEAPYLEFATVTVPNNTIEIAWSPSESVEVTSYEIFRQIVGMSGFEHIQTVSAFNELRFTDNIDIGSEAICYKVKAIDPCGNASAHSNPGCIIIPEVQEENLTNRLSWDPYHSWLLPVENYQIYRSDDGQAYEMIETLPGDDSAYLWRDENLTDFVEEFCYQVKAMEISGITSFSTEACAKQNAHYFVPNSFSPEISHGLNDTFGPEGMYIENYHLQIYNRWGQLIYESKDGEPWDGKSLNGEYVENGVYIYTLHVFGFNEEVDISSGSVTVVR